MRHAENGRWTHALSVLVVLVGLLAMHGTTGEGHHGGASSSAPGVLASTAGAATAHAHEGAGAPAAAVEDRGCDPACPGAGSGLVLLCLAVLLAGGAALLLGLRRRVGSAPLRALPPPRVTGRTPAPRRPPDVVAELCVSRT